MTSLVALTQYQCPSCGATVQSEASQLSSLCSFCDTPIVKQNELAEHQFDELMPFRINQKEASQKILQHIRDSWFVPKALKEKIRPDELHSMFVPFWVLQATTTSHYQADIGIHYTETETVTKMKDGKMVTETKTVTKTDWHPLSGTHVHQFQDYIICASKGLPNSEIRAIEPFDFGQALQFSADLLAGRSSELPVLDVDTAFANGTQHLYQQVNQEIRGFLTGNEQRLSNVDTDVKASRDDVRCALLPIWIATITYKGEPLRMLVNGQTGIVGGDIPKDWKKIVLIVIGIVISLIGLYAIGAA